MPLFDAIDTRISRMSTTVAWVVLVTLSVSAIVVAVDGRIDGTLGHAFLLQMVLVNVTLGLFNLLPFPPLDGGTVLAGFEKERDRLDGMMNNRGGSGARVSDAGGTGNARQVSNR